MFQSFSKRKKNFFGNIDTKTITDDKSFWESVNPFLANKISSNHNKMTITEKDEIISRSKDVTEIFNPCFINVVSNLGVVINESLLGKSTEKCYPIVNITERY